MLQGTFETLSLPEVLGLLASARKSGALWLDAGPVAGVVHVQDGHCHAAEAPDQRGPLDNAPDLLVRLVDVCFAVMCQESGSFRFAAEESAPWTCREPVELSDALVEVDRLLKQWREILRVIPSLECRPRLLETLEVEELVVDRDRWALLVAVDGRRTVRELVQRTERPVLDVCHSLLELVEAGAIGVVDPAAARAAEIDEPAVSGAALVEAQLEAAVAMAEPVPPPAPEPARQPEFADAAEAVLADAAPGEDQRREVRVAAEVAELHVVRDPEAEPAHADGSAAPIAAHAAPAQAEPVAAPMAEAAGGAPESPDRGAFLRLFSGLRES